MPSELPSKIFETRGKPFNWRKKWKLELSASRFTAKSFCL
ncbi:DUF2256 domain-containing protein [Kaistella sp.]